MSGPRIAEVEVLQCGFEMTGSQTFVRIKTEDGTSGLGQSGGWGSPAAVAGILREFTPLLVGGDSFRTEHYWNLLHRVRPFRGNYLSSAVSAVDLALWDIKGKVLGVPVWELLGGYSRDRIRLHALLMAEEPAQLAVDAKRAVEEGFTAVKFDPLGPETGAIRSMPRLISDVRESADAVRQAVGDVDLIFELHRRLDPAQAVMVANALVEFEPLFIEDPLQIDSSVAQALIAGRINAPTATGERISSPWEVRDLLSHGTPMHLRPDLGLAGGLTGCRKIAAVAEAHSCGISPHNFLGPGLTAPTAHLSANVPNLITMEYHAIDESSPSSGAIRSSIVRDGGYIVLPDAPGLGIELLDNFRELSPALEVPLTLDRLIREDGSVTRAV